MESIWTASTDGIDAELEPMGDGDHWILSLEGRGMSGYPEIALDFNQLVSLRDAINAEIVR